MLNNLAIIMEKETEGAREIFSKVVRAGRRTYFFDVKTTRGDDYFVTITESRKMIDKNGAAYYEKHKIHLYKEDFDKYAEGLSEVIEYIKDSKPDFFNTDSESSLRESFAEREGLI